MAARFAVVTEEEIAQIKEDSIPKKKPQKTYLENTGFFATPHRAVSETKQ
jgi:hypothetical protein